MGVNNITGNSMTGGAPETKFIELPSMNDLTPQPDTLIPTYIDPYLIYHDNLDIMQLLTQGVQTGAPGPVSIFHNLPYENMGPYNGSDSGSVPQQIQSVSVNFIMEFQDIFDLKVKIFRTNDQADLLGFPDYEQLIPAENLVFQDYDFSGPVEPLYTTLVLDSPVDILPELNTYIVIGGYFGLEGFGWNVQTTTGPSSSDKNVVRSIPNR